MSPSSVSRLPTFTVMDAQTLLYVKPLTVCYDTVKDKIFLTGEETSFDGQQPIVKMLRTTPESQDLTLTWLTDLFSLKGAIGTLSAILNNGHLLKMLRLCEEWGQASFLMNEMVGYRLERRRGGSRHMPSNVRLGSGVPNFLGDDNYPAWFAPTADPTIPHTPYLTLERRWEDSPNYVMWWVVRMVGVNEAGGGGEGLAASRWDDRETFKELLSQYILQDSDMLLTRYALTDPERVAEYASQKRSVLDVAREKVGILLDSPANRVNLQAVDNIVRRESSEIPGPQRRVVGKQLFPPTIASQQREIVASFWVDGVGHIFKRSEWELWATPLTRSKKRVNLLHVTFPGAARPLGWDVSEQWFLVGNPEIAVQALLVQSRVQRRWDGTWGRRTASDNTLDNVWDSAVAEVFDANTGTWARVRVPDLAEIAAQ